jgi:RNA polymerase sigma-70 factor, ECF subfamily
MSTTQAYERASLMPPRTFGSEDDEVTLVVAAQSGSHQAFEILVGRYQARILCIVKRFTRSREDAEDIVQQSFQNAFVHLQQFERISSFSTWLTRIAINKALMLLRARRTSREIPIEQSSTRDETVPPLDFRDPNPSPEDRCLGRERKRVLARAINKLAPELRIVIELRELHEMSTRDTARALGLSVPAVKTRVFRGRRKLRAMLRGYAGPKSSDRKARARFCTGSNLQGGTL